MSLSFSIRPRRERLTLRFTSGNIVFRHASSFVNAYKPPDVAENHERHQPVFSEWASTRQLGWESHLNPVARNSISLFQGDSNASNKSI
jgi:hypothetical protein